MAATTGKMKHARSARNISDSQLFTKSLKISIDQEKLVKHKLQKFWNCNDAQVASTYDSVVKELLGVDWTCLKGTVLKEYKAFLLQLSTTNTVYLKSVLSMLIGKFCFKDAKDENYINTKADHESIFNEIHTVLQNIILLVPLSPVVLVNLLTSGFPYISRDSYVQFCYVKNLLRIINYLPSERRTILEIIVNHLTKLDVHSPKHELLDAGLEDTEFNMELDCMDEEEEKGMTKPEPSLPHTIGNTLDLLMNLMFQYIQNVCFTNEELDWEATKSLYHDFILIFEKLILPTHECCHVQFLMFYICSFNLSLSEMFLDWLWKKVRNPSTATIIRQASVAYVGSFLARSKYIPLKNITDYLNLMSQWVHHYIDSDGGGSRTVVDVTVHGPFYSVCQAIFYIFAFRHKELHDMKKGAIFLRNLNLQRMVTCRLNPLKVCLPTIVQNFASVARNYQLAYCYTIIERNQRASLPVISYSSTKNVQMTNVNPLDSFFPFDPYVLPRSSHFISPLFNEYQTDTEEKEVAAEMEEDDFLEAEMITPDVVSALPEFLVYSTSPGFTISPT